MPIPHIPSLSSLADLPLELQSHIASFLPLSSTVQLYSTNRFFQSAKPVFNPLLLQQLLQRVIKTMICHDSRIFIMDHTHTLFACGSNASGQLGLGNMESPHSFKEVTELPAGKRIIKVCTGSKHTFILFEDGSLFATGDNSHGQLGLGDKVDRDVFTAVHPLPPEKKIKDVIAGAMHSFILFDDGTLFTCGSNLEGELGIGDNVGPQRFTPVTQLPLEKKIQNIIASDYFSFILFDDNTLYACGRNSCGQLGLGNNNNTNQFEAVTLLPADKKIKEVIAGGMHSFIIFDDGTLFACGSNSFGQLGMGNNAQFHQFVEVTNPHPGSTIQKLIVGPMHSFIIFDDGALFACGGNCYDQLGFGTHSHKHFEVIGTLPSGKKVQNVATGYSHSFILFEDKTLFVCGQNETVLYRRKKPELSFEPVGKFNHWVELYEHKSQQPRLRM